MKWTLVADRLPRGCMDILFSDGKYIYAGWLESISEDEDPSFFSICDQISHWPKNITHWMYFPVLPENDG